jgi:hypothetical protein
MIYPSKRLIFYFYIKDNWIENTTNRIHLLCLKHYAHIFDEAVFVISVDDINNYELIHSFEMAVLDLGFTPNISFKIVENTYLREARTFYDLIAKKLDEYDGLTFFGHNKGLTNVNAYDVESVSLWILSLYYFSLEYYEEATYQLTDGRELSFGPLLNEINGMDINVTEEGIIPRKHFIEKTEMSLGKEKYLYMGTFFWLNGGALYEYMRKNDKELPKLTDRWYAENFCANIFPLQLAFSHNGRFAKNYFQEGSEIDALVDLLTTKEEKEQFNEFKNNILSQL